jgi:GAF domain-containing protein
MSEADFRSLFERMADAALIADAARGRVLAVNEAFAEMVGRRRETLAGSPLDELLTFDDDAADEEPDDSHQRSGNLFVGHDEGWTRVGVESLPCVWDESEALLYLLRRSATADAGALDGEQMRAIFNYLQVATEQVEVVNRVVAAVNSSRTIDEVFSLASQQMRSLIPFDRASIALCEDADESLRVFALSGEHTGSLAVGAKGPMHGSVTELALAERRMVVIPEVREERRFNIYEDLELEGFRSAVCVPLFSTHAAVGSLNLTSRTPDAFNRQHLLALERLAPPLAIAIEKVLLLEQAERRSRAMEAAAQREALAGHIGRKLASSLAPSSVLQETVDMLGRALHVERCFIALFGEGDGDAMLSYEYLARPDVLSMRGHTQPLRASAHARRVLKSGEAVQIADLSETERDDLRELYERLKVCSVLAAPVHAGGARDGLLEVHDCHRPRTWTEEEQKLLCTVAGQVSVALTNAQLYEASRHRNEELRGLFEISRTFSTLSDTSEISGRLARSIAKLVGGEICLIATYDRRTNTVRAEAPGYQTPPELIREFHFALDKENQHAPVYLTGESFVSNDPLNDPRLNRVFIERYGIHSALSVPMRIKRELIGFIYVGNRPGGFRERDMRLLEIFAAQAAETIVNARLFLTIQAQAEREAVVNRLLLSLQRSGEPKDKVRAVIERVGEVLELDRCIVVLFAEGDHPDYYGEWCAEGVAPVTQWADVRERSPIRYALRTTRRPMHAADVRQHPLSAGLEDLIERAQLKSLMVVPIMHQGRVIGSISGHQTRRQRDWGEDDIDLLTAVATHVGSTLENARLIAELREANRLKDEFLAMLSHELRTPLTAITGWVDLLGEHPSVESDAELSDGIEAISASATSLTQLISDLLDLSRIQRGVLRLEREPFDINHAISNTVRTVRQAAIARRIDLRLELEDPLPLTVADAQRLQQVLWNLLSNALKFTPEGGTVTLRSRLLEDGAKMEGGASDAPRRQWIVIEVEDTGEGIAPDFLPYIWDRFRQADSSATRRHGGLGIGLALVRELVEAHGGQVEAESNGSGAKFRVSLPVVDAEEWLEREEPNFGTRLREDAEPRDFN